MKRDTQCGRCREVKVGVIRRHMKMMAELNWKSMGGRHIHDYEKSANRDAKKAEGLGDSK